MKFHYVIAIGLIGVGIFLSCEQRPHTPIPTPIPAPSFELQAIVAPLKEFKGKKNAAEAAQFYADFADVVQRNESTIQTYGQLRAAHLRAQKLFVQKTDVTSSNLSSAIDRILVQVLGKDDVAIDRPKIVAIFNAIAWALE